MTTCAYTPCSKEFQGKYSTAKYCSSTCRAKDSVLRKVKIELSGTPLFPKESHISRQTTPSGQATISRGLDFQTQYVFDSQKKEIERWETAFNKEKALREKTQEEKAKLAQELAELKTDLRIADVSKPTGLSGFMENPLIQQLAPHLGPVLAGVLERALAPKQPALAGPDETAQWVVSQTPEVQNALRELIAEVAKLQEPSKILEAILKFKSSLLATKQSSQFVVGGPVRVNGHGFFN